MAQQLLLPLRKFFQKNENTRKLMLILQQFRLCNDTIFNDLTIPERKQNDNRTEYRKQEPSVFRDFQADRVFPLDSVAIQSFRAEHDVKLDKAIVHDGPFADEFARMLNVYAIVFGEDIYFRWNAYKPETEESGKILAHELAHIAQYEEERIRNVSEEELEAEAEAAEESAGYGDEEMLAIEAGGELYRFPRSKMKEIAREVAEEIREWMRAQKRILSESEYLALLCRYQKWLNGRLD